MKTILIYQSHYGATAQYARWLAEDTGAEICPLSRARGKDLAGCDRVVFGGGLYASGLAGFKAFCKLAARVPPARVTVFTVGLADLADPACAQARQTLRGLVDGAFPGAALYHLRGGMDWRRLSPLHKAMMSMMGRMLAKKPADELTAQDRTLRDWCAARGGAEPLDFSSRAALAPLLAHLGEA